ncbi:S26 family signal peptidase [Halomonas sp. LBP4]|uniref:S26 family signal peptidase n=1 Tax=Halomonas sp. LBP4 TaxID=2044917 RepID=UPI000D752B76|nr:S26 family signal peptidase [Halomonas sp. LBP4]PXX95833.1 S26 family signal peptidase [Halomonas sp. LBP4]
MSKRQHQSTPRFVAKMGVVAALILTTGYTFASRYHFGLDTQEVKCIGDYSLFLVDRHDRDLQPGNIYAFSAQGVEPYFEEGTQMVKILRGVPGDHIRVTEQGDVFVNDKLIGQGLILAEEVGGTPADFAGETVLDEGAYWFMGETPYSFDSRYWGTVSEEQIIGQARPII